MQIVHDRLYWIDLGVFGYIRVYTGVYIGKKQ